MTHKYQNTRSERDQFKKQNEELQEQVCKMGHSMSQMVSCTNNTSQSFPMFSELKMKIEFHYMD